MRRRWLTVMGALWIQAFTGTNGDFSAYSSQLKAAMGITQSQLNNLATASDLGKALGWSSGFALRHLPIHVVLFLSAFLGFSSYALQWLFLSSRLSLSYLLVFWLCLVAGCSVCWFNTICFVLCVRSFPVVNCSLALSLSVSFNGVSAALYSLFANVVISDGAEDSSVYLLLNALLPLVVSLLSLPAILPEPTRDDVDCPAGEDTACRGTGVFLALHVLAFITGLYLLFLHSVSANLLSASIVLAGAIALLVLPLGFVFSRPSCDHRGRNAEICDDVEANKMLMHPLILNGHHRLTDEIIAARQRWWRGVMEKDRIGFLGEEHSARKLIGRIDFWLYYVAYFCSATVGLVYSNNLGQIAQSLRRQPDLTTLVTVFSSCSLFGRLLSAAPDFLRGKVMFARTGWFAAAAAAMPLAFFLLSQQGQDGREVLITGTALIGLGSGFIFAAAVSVSSELFGANSMGVNHNILITNIPLGSLLYGQIAAWVYDANGQNTSDVTDGGDAVIESMIVCMGSKCYADTFFIWGCITLLGLALSVLLFLRTKSAYSRRER